MARKFADFMVERRSRRGFLALCGKLTLALGAAMTGVSLTGLTARAACCASPACTGCGNPPAVCPFGYAPTGTTFCCDAGSSTCHSCVTCYNAAANPPTCFCEQDLGSSCSKPPC